ncbi:polyketide cyclase [Nocardia sp. SYP-A9097]|uniref:SRPBCC family protein n=1 Tax=Nocardia sp. SYP-A9097 TaxID=2663237 RepID=UPI00129B6544|nr:SRPBCC family protein [Nocardia sp. SYP-A9097]MRH90514.1 polyketide cyclase [Nocardia sp. SYP-A9097]
MTSLEFGSIEREIHVDAPPEVVFEVVSSPEHISEWWTDDASFEVRPGAVGELVWGDCAKVMPMTVVTAEPPRVFAFRWCYPDDKADDSVNSMLVTFELTPSGSGTKIRMVETGFREMGWEVAKLEEQYQEHVDGWDTFIPRLGNYIAGLVSTL